MVWNEPGGENKNNDKKDEDIWSRHKKRQQQPPNIDELLGKFFTNLQQALGFKRKRTGGRSPSKQSGDGFFIKLGMGLLLIFLIFWVASGVYFVQQPEEAIVLRFGHYYQTVGAGAHWYPRFIDTVYKQNVQQTQTLEYNSKMLTKDTNIIEVQLTVNYRIDNLRDYLFSVDDARRSLAEATASATRQVIGQTRMDAALSADRGQVGDNIQTVLLNIIKNYKTGLKITGINFQLARPPQEVADAFDDAIKANQDKKRYIKEANAYSARITPVAQGTAARIKRLALADKQQMIAKAQGDVAPFLSWLTQYQTYPQVTRDRLYIDTLERVLAHNAKVFIDTKRNNVMMLPLGKLVNGDASHTKATQMLNAGLAALPEVSDTNNVNSTGETR